MLYFSKFSPYADRKYLFSQEKIILKTGNRKKFKLLFSIIMNNSHYLFNTLSVTLRYASITPVHVTCSQFKLSM